eukprot:jgi/Botrbrau1/3025/Bobra.0070s0021.1
MKFKAEFSDRGIWALEKGLLPTLDKHGKTCQILISPDDLHIFQLPSTDTDGMHIVARWTNAALFEPGTVNVQSRHRNLIAFQLEVGLLLRVMRAAAANAADRLEVKLTMRALPGSGGEGAPVPRPYLTYTSKGQNLHMVQDLPISKPYPPSGIDRLSQEKDSTALCPYYLDIQRDIPRLQAMVDKVRSLSPGLTLACCKGGTLHLAVREAGLELGSEVQPLPVVPANVAAEAPPFRRTSPEGRLQEALENGSGSSVVVQLKHIARSLHSSQLTEPAKVLLGISENSGYVHLIFVYNDPYAEGGVDQDISLAFKLPVREEA